MEQIKKKMAVLRETLADAEDRADKAEAELKEANERAANVSPCLIVEVFALCGNLLLRLSIMIVEFQRIAG